MDNQQANDLQTIAATIRDAISEGIIDANIVLADRYPPHTENLPLNRSSMEQMLWCNVYSHMMGGTSCSSSFATDEANEAVRQFNNRFPKGE